MVSHERAYYSVLSDDDNDDMLEDLRKCWIFLAEFFGPLMSLLCASHENILNYFLGSFG